MELEITEKTSTALLAYTEALIDDTLPLVSNLANLSRLLFEGFDGVSWAGFYLTDDSLQNMYLGPYQGPIACTRIPFTKGVCGAAAREQKTQLVQNVHEFPGHIACSSLTNSELVVPILKNGLSVGVIDLDSEKMANFTEEHAQTLEKIAQILAKLF